MTFQVQRIGDSYGVLFTAEQMRSAGFQEGTQVEIMLRELGEASLPEKKEEPSIRYMTLEEGIAAFEATEERWAETYRELAK